jgi:osmoprotectant transport system substrate-binding protein
MIHRKGLALAVAAATMLAACGGDDDDATDPVPPADTDAASPTDAPATDSAPATSAPRPSAPEGPGIVIGAQDFGESAILAEIYGQALSAAGYPVEQQALGGYRDLVFTAFDSGDINFTPEYAASALEFLNENAGEATPDAAETTAALQTHLAELGLVALEPSPAVDSNSFVVSAETAAAMESPTVSALTPEMSLGGPTDCPENPYCIPGLQDVYGIDMSANFVPLDGGGPLTVAALEGGEIDVAILFSTNGVIADKGWVVLEDDQGLINADNIVPVASELLTAAYGDDFQQLVNGVSAALSTEELTELNRRYDIDKEDADAIAGDWLASEGLAG